MDKRGWLTILMILTLALGSVATVHAEIIPPYGEGQIGLQAVVLCESLTVRREPRADSAAVRKFKYGDPFLVLKQENGWAECCVSDDVDASPVGWVNVEYVAVDPAWYRTDAATPVYAWNDTAAPKVALLDTDTILPVLKDDGEWLVVSLRGAAGWIYRNTTD